MLPNQLAAIGSDAAIPAMIDEIVAAAQGSDADRAELRAYAASRLADIRDLAAHLDSPEDGADLYRTMAALWMELRFEWQRHNDVIGYQIARTGVAEPRAIGYGTVSSLILERIEQLIAPADLEVLAKYALDLLMQAQPGAVLKAAA